MLTKLTKLKFTTHFKRLKHVELDGSRSNGSRFRIVKKPRITLPIVSPVAMNQQSKSITSCVLKYSPVSSSSPTSTQRIENWGSMCANPSRGGLLHTYSLVNGVALSTRHNDENVLGETSLMSFRSLQWIIFLLCDSLMIKLNCISFSTQSVPCHELVFKLHVSAYLEQLVTNFRNSRRSSSVKSFPKMSHSQLITRCESWKPPKYCVFRRKSFKSSGLVSPDTRRCSSTVENNESQSRLMMLRKPRMNAEVCSQIWVCMRKNAMLWI